MNQGTVFPSQGSLIQGSDKLQTMTISQGIVVNSLLSGNVLLSGATITGLNDPVTGTDSATKNYVNNSFGINKSTSVINNNENTTYTVSQILGGFIQRVLTTDRTDKFPSAAELVAALKATNTTLNYIKCTIQNMSTTTDFFTLTVDLLRTGITLLGDVGTGTNVIINPESLCYFTIFVTNATVGSEAVNIYGSKSLLQSLPESLYFYQNGLIFNNTIRTTNNFSNNTSVYTVTSAGTYTANQIINSIITRTSSAGTDIFPSSSSVVTALGFTSSDAVVGSWTFQTLIRNKTGSSITLTGSSDIIFNFTDPYTLENNKCVLLYTRYIGSGVFSVEIIRKTGF